MNLSFGSFSGKKIDRDPSSCQKPNHPLGKKGHGLERKIFRGGKISSLSIGTNFQFKRLFRQKWRTENSSGGLYGFIKKAFQTGA